MFADPWPESHHDRRRPQPAACRFCGECIGAGFRLIPKKFANLNPELKPTLAVKLCRIFKQAIVSNPVQTVFAGQARLVGPPLPRHLMFSMAMGDPEARRLARQLDVIAGNGSIKTLAEQSGKSKKKARTEKNNKKSLSQVQFNH